MSARSSLVLMIALLVLGSFAFFDPFALRAKREDNKEKAQRVFWLKDKKLESIRLEREADTVELKCTQEAGCAFDGSGNWRLVTPVEGPADPTAVGSLAGSILNLTHSDRVELTQAPDPAEFGFGPKAPKVELKVKGENEPYRIELGQANPVGAGFYLVTNRDPHVVFVGPAFLPDMVKKELFHWRDKRFFPGVNAEATAWIEWSGPAGKYRAEKKDERWTLTQPVAAPADPVMWGGLASTLAYASAKRVVAENSASPEGRKLIAGKPRFTLRFGFAPPAAEAFPVTLWAMPGAKAPEYVAQVREGGPLFAVDATVFTRFEKGVADYRERHLAPGFRPESAAEISFEFPRQKKKLSLRREAGRWTYASGDKPEETLSQARLESFVTTLARVEARDFLPANNPVAGAFRRGPADVIFHVKPAGEGEVAAKGSMLVAERRWAITDGPVPGEVMRFGEDLLRALPVRIQDLYASANQQVVATPPAPEEKPHGNHDHDHDHGHAH